MEHPIISIKQGQLKGFKAKDFDNQEYYKFLGLPYAKPPVGNLRFKAPQPAEGWSGVRDATKQGSQCYSLNPWTNGPEVNYSGSEDCLFLNVYTRYLPNSGNAPRPVMVHLHGGAFTIGSGNEEFFGTPNFLMTGDIVFVNINYRLGVFGFLSLEDPSLDVPGNAGLKDQRLALEWVKENIASFNGDPNNVTIFGCSAGGASVHYQLLSESSRGLFHKAISQSGTALSTWAWGSQNAIELAQKIDGNVKTEKDALEVLMELDVEQLFDAAKQIEDNLFGSGKRRPFSPVVEKPNPTAFLNKSPVEIMKNGEYNHVPLIIGCVSNEGLLVEASSIVFPFQFTKDDFVPWFFDLQPGSPQHTELTTRVEDFYFKNGETDEAKHEFYSDVLFIAGIVECIKLQSKNAKFPIYFYNFDAVTSIAKKFMEFMFNGKPKKEFKGASHGGENLYLFHRDTLEPDAEDVKIMRYLIQLWTSFARTGIPQYEEIKWEPVNDVDNLKALNIDTELSMVDNPYEKRTTFWEKCFEKYPLKFD